MSERRMRNLGDSQTAVNLDAVLGAAGLFGIGEFYLGPRFRAAGFLAMSGVLYTCLVCAITTPSLSFLWGWLPSTWGLGYSLLLFDILHISDKIDEGAKR